MPFRLQVTTLRKLFAHMCLCHQAALFDTGQGAVMSCGWGGNRRSGVALAMRHRLQWFIHHLVHGYEEKHPLYGPITIAIRARFEYDSTTIRARYNILRGVMCFRAIMNTSILSRCCRMLQHCSQSAIPRRGFYLYNDVIVTYTVFTCVWRVCSKSIVAAKFTHNEH